MVAGEAKGGVSAWAVSVEIGRLCRCVASKVERVCFLFSYSPHRSVRKPERDEEDVMGAEGFHGPHAQERTILLP